MTLLYITNGITGPGGLERVLSIKASLLADHYGYEVHIVSLNESKPNPFYSFSTAIQFHNITVSGNPLKYLAQYIQGIRAIVKKVQPDIISVCDDGLKAFFLPFILGKKIPLVYERHVSKAIEWHHQPSWIEKKWIRLKWQWMSVLGNQFDAFVVLTQGNLKEWPHLKNTQVISNPLPFFPEESATLQNKKIIAVGKHSYQKGFDLLLQAWKLVLSHTKEWELNIYGKSDHEQTLQQLAHGLKIESFVNFHPPTKNIKNQYLDSSICVVSSRFEGFGMTLIEAMACGLPCVAFDCPHGPADIITHQEDGILVENGNVSALADAMMQLMADDHMLKLMGENAKMKVTRYLPDVILPQWDSLFRQLCTRKSK